MVKAAKKLYAGIRAKVGKRRRVALFALDDDHYMIELKGLYDKEGDGPASIRVAERGDLKVVTTYILITKETLGLLAGIYYKMEVDKETAAAAEQAVKNTVAVSRAYNRGSQGEAWTSGGSHGTANKLPS
ncbi:MAG TPA: hypothetical protein VFL54_04495 [Gammaproteobacteria bacterium]|nr:hypothetical protein [Gammaproteobacteria bacterium]